MLYVLRRSFLLTRYLPLSRLNGANPANIDENGVDPYAKDLLQIRSQIGLMVHSPAPNIRSVIVIYRYRKDDVYLYAMRYSKKDFNKNVTCDYDLDFLLATKSEPL